MPEYPAQQPLCISRERHHKRPSIEADLGEVLKEVEAKDAIDAEKRRGTADVDFDVGNPRPRSRDRVEGTEHHGQ